MVVTKPLTAFHLGNSDLYNSVLSTLEQHFGEGCLVSTWQCCPCEIRNVHEAILFWVWLKELDALHARDLDPIDTLGRKWDAVFKRGFIRSHQRLPHHNALVAAWEQIPEEWRLYQQQTYSHGFGWRCTLYTHTIFSLVHRTLFIRFVSLKT